MTAPRFHSRHIPQEWLNWYSPIADFLKGNGLLDILEPDNLRAMADAGIELIETRACWYESEVEPGVFDWSRLDRDMTLIEKAGLKPGVFPWFQHPPIWYNQTEFGHARLRCLEHDMDSTIASLWDERTIEVYERCYQSLAEHFAGRIHHLQIGVYGDYGETAFPSGVRHYLWSPPHGHHGLWAGDAQARASYARWLKKKYDSLDQLNRRWGTRFGSWDDDLMPRMPFVENDLTVKRDFMDWYTSSLVDFVDAVLKVARKYFPEVSAGIPMGFPDENLGIGQIKSRIAKVAARYNVNARWTGSAYFKDYAISNAAARRISSAAHFYGTTFGTEAATFLEKDNVTNALYEYLSNASSIIHDDPSNILGKNGYIQQRIRPSLFVSPSQSRVAVYYPTEGEMLGWPVPKELAGMPVGGDLFESALPYASAYYRQAKALRSIVDYQICDSYMIADGCLDQMDDLVFVISCPVPEATAQLLIKWLGRGGRAWILGKAEIEVLETSAPLAEMAERAGHEVHIIPDVTDESAIRVLAGPYMALREKVGGGTNSFLTEHEDRVSLYTLGKYEIPVFPKPNP